MADNQLSDAALRTRAEQIVGKCRCHEAYTTRKMVDPGCPWHEYYEEIVDVLRTVRDAQLERDAKILCSRCQEGNPPVRAPSNIDPERIIFIHNGLGGRSFCDANAIRQPEGR